MTQTILVTGCFGYIGTALIQRLIKNGHHVIGIDADHKTKWLKEMESVSAIDIHEIKVKQSIFETNNKNFKFYQIDIAKDHESLKGVFGLHKFDTIVNLAQMPAAPYSQINHEKCSWTIYNNTFGNLNLVWLMREFCPEAHLIEIESMGTFNPAIGVDIPEGKFQFEFNGKTSEPSIFPKQAGSFYHLSKVFNTYTNECVNRWWGIKSTSVNQGVVYGNWTPEIEQTQVHSHLSVDESFGTVLNRFVVQAMMDVPLTVFGKGKQKRGYLALNDSVQCLELFIDNPPESKELRIVNQLDTIYTVNQLADIVKIIGNEYGYNVKIDHIESPRIENTDDFFYNPHLDTLQKLGYKRTREIYDEIRYMFEMVNKSVLPKLKDTVTPKIKWS